MRWLVLAVLGAACAGGCDPGGPSVEPSDPRAQPGATVVPLETAGLIMPDGGIDRPVDSTSLVGDAAPPAPEPFGAYDEPPVDRLSGTLDGVLLRAVWKLRQDGARPEPPEASRAAIETLRQATTAYWSIEVAAIGRLRAEIAGRGQSLPQKTALMVRDDFLGAALVWPNGTRFRLLPPGTLRNALGDRRADVTPLSPGTVEARGTSERLGMSTRKLLVRSASAEVELELATVDLAGRGAPLLCRMILDVAGVEPNAEACVGPELLVSADIRWAMPEAAGEKPGIRFEVVEITTNQELQARRLTVPPVSARFVTSGLPGTSRTVFLSDRELGQLREEATAPGMPPADDAPKDGLIADNRSDRLMFLLVDGVTVGAVPPWQSMAITALKNARYTLEWQAFWGEVSEVVSQVDLPARIVHGAPPTEKPDAG